MFFALAPLVIAGGCAKEGQIDPSGGITAMRSACPEVGVPAGTGDITLFNPKDSRLASAIDVTATITNVRAACNDSGDQVVSQVTFDIEARRSDTSAARDVTFPYFITVVRGGTAVTAKRVAQASVHFAAGQARAQVSAQGSSVIARSAATLPQDVRDKITQKRKAGDENAAVDPLSDPAVRSAVARATFETLVGFQLTSDQLKYNLTR
ncbi:hypothetical protein KY084_11465 [Stakelama sp. CBK3Z-3]|uniref:Lipoprotein n=1 Tax=Stakelama flava TaxID=2860338 RepID=A0ABS6XQ07_9SPHN|nr:hypothetical protein [Stakelama flava]MBW4331485.1 hypothetical protein [Stakelama flava]